MRCQRFLRKQVKFSRFVLARVKVLLYGARDFFVNTFRTFAGMIGEGSAVMTGFVILPQVYVMPGKYSSTSSSTKEKRSTESSREHIRAITTRNVKGNISQTNGGGQGKLISAVSEKGSCDRSYSIDLGQIGRIDEDGPCDFAEISESNKNM
ncbi:hypothetical protein POM88_053665 [Heracleum sosnowskyi]|uniref:Uncharacterized protein n=1 Tax=Heracleum sosnowskyi TaxID=360622 RepID=A0AAD8GPB1_9APIA|nr:hypothetical protein POM88_053665 [Heracleum sosnowskyi]